MQDTLTSAVTTAVDTLASTAEAARWKYTGIESIVQGDGVMISIIGIIVVFIALTIITLVIRALKGLAAPKNKAVAPPEAAPVTNGVSGEIIAAIALALQTHLFELHDEEKTIITIQRVSRPYSPWSSKLHGMRSLPYKYTTNR